MDLYMSLIHACDLNGADPFDYLTQLQRDAKKVRARPEQWMPGTYLRTHHSLPPGLAYRQAGGQVRR
jgi:transposase